MNPRPIALADDGLIPNSLLPLLVYAAALGEVTDRAVAFEALFASNGWSRSWRNGIYVFRRVLRGRTGWKGDIPPRIPPSNLCLVGHPRELLHDRAKNLPAHTR